MTLASTRRSILELYNNGSGPEIDLPGRTLPELLQGKHCDPPFEPVFGLPEKRFRTFPVAVRPANIRPGMPIANPEPLLSTVSHDVGKPVIAGGPWPPRLRPVLGTRRRPGRCWCTHGCGTMCSHCCKRRQTRSLRKKRKAAMRTKAKWQRMLTIRFLSTKRDRNTDCTEGRKQNLKPTENDHKPRKPQKPGVMAFCISTPTVPVVRSVPASSYVGRAFYQSMLPPLRSHACGAKPEQSGSFFISLSLSLSFSLSISLSLSLRMTRVP